MHSVAAAPSPLAVSPLQMAADALDRLDREDPAEMPAAALGEEIEELFTIQHRVAAAITRRVAAFDRGKGCAALEAHSTAAWLRRQVRLAPNAASEQVRVARELDRRPEVGRAFTAGEVGFAHAQVITRVLEGAPAEVAREAEPALVEVARRTDAHRLGMATRHLRHAFTPEAALDEARHNHDRRRLHLSESMDGLYYIDGVLDTEGGALLRTALDAVRAPPAREDERTPAQRRADALTDLARRQLDSGELPQVGGQRPHLTLTADVATLARLPGSRAADMDWGMPVPAETLRRIACDAAVTCVLVSPAGDPLSVGRTRRTFTPAQRKALALRDGGCVLCGRP
ncbi:MAG TPA: DUF222 domain-containing protein, partial [Candidatus Dormibacteraeota bacterium]|nr:DUF222 domain-containing protein [Candidatus Dormibacteraeota bacterium]